MKASTITLLTSSLLVHAHPIPIANPTEQLDRRYAKGWCTLHVTQYDNLGLAVPNVFDNSKNKIGGNIGKSGSSISVTSQLPHTIEISSGATKNDPVSFAYAGAHWLASDLSHCGLGKWDSGKREMDCGFTC